MLERRRGAITVAAAMVLGLIVATLGPGASTSVEAAEAAGYTAVTPARLMDTRPGKTTVDGQSAGTGAFAQSRELTVTGRGGVPGNEVVAVVVSVTVTSPSTAGYSTVHPTGQARPTASNLNYTAGQTTPNLVIAKVGTGGKITIYNSTSAHVLVDVLGWFPTVSDYSALSPRRLMDTRPGATTVDSQFAGTGSYANSRELTVAGRGGVPTNGAGAVVVNVTVTGPATAGYSTVHPSGQARPTASNLNYTAGQTTPNLVIAKVGTGGKITIYNSTTAHVLVDVLGWFPTGSEFTGLSPARLMDTRAGKTTVDGDDAAGGAYANSRDLTVAGRDGIPSTGVGAVVVNVTVTGPSTAGYSTVHPTGEARPTASNLNYTAGQTTPNLVIAKVGTDGQITIYNSTTAHVLVDVLGWFPADTGPQITSNWQQVESGADHSCAVTTAGAARCWGLNSSGQLGDGTTTTRLTPVTVSGLESGVESISVGGSSTCAVTATGGVRCWGNNSAGQLGDGSTTNRTTPVAVTGLTSGVTDISVGASHTCALAAAGAAKCWGLNDEGQVGDGSTTNRTTPVAVTGLTSGVTDISAGGSHTCAITSSAGAKCWGRNTASQIGDASSIRRTSPVDVTGLTSGVQSISAGGAHSCAVTTTAAAKCWGDNPSGQVGDGSTTDRSTPVAVTALGSDVADIEAGVAHTCALTTSGGALCWGSNVSGQIGDGTTGNRSTPTSVAALSSDVVVQLSAGGGSCAVTMMTTAKCWGENGSGQVGDGTRVDRPDATRVIG